MKVWLIINSFYGTEKFVEIYDMYRESAERLGLDFAIRKTSDLNFSIQKGIPREEKPDFAIFYDKDIYLAEQLENAGIKIFNSKKAIENCDNKALTYLTISRHHIDFPETYISPKTFEGLGYTKFDFFKRVSKQLGFPLIIKEVYGSFGEQVYLINTYEEGVKVIKRMRFKEFVMQKFISASKGKDIRVNVVNGKVICAMERHNPNSYISNITHGGTGRQVTLTKEQENIALAAAKSVGCFFAGVDLLMDENNRPMICEINSNPHIKSTLHYCGVDLSEIILKEIISTLK